MRGYMPAWRVPGADPVPGPGNRKHAWLSVPSILGCVLAVCVLAAASAALGLRKVVVTPLGVRTRQTADGAHWVRGLIAAVVVVVGVVAMGGMLSSFGAFIVIIAVMGGCFGLALLALNLMGPWILRLRASSQLKRAKRPEQLLAARTVLESPKELWRQVGGGVAMTSFVGGYSWVSAWLWPTPWAPALTLKQRCWSGTSTPE